MYQAPNLLFNKNLSQVQLQFLNLKNASKQIAILNDFPNLQKLSLHGNNLTFLPSLQGLKKLVHLDLTNNPIKVNHNLVDSLYSAPSLNQLKINCSQQQSFYLCQHLPNLQFLNGKDIIRMRQQVQDFSYQKASIQEVNKQKQNIKKIYLQLLDIKSKMSVKMSDGLQITQKQLNESIQQIIRQYQLFQNNVNNIKAKQVIKHYSKNRMLQVIDQILIDILNQNYGGGDNQLISMMFKINGLKKTHFQNILKTILQISYQQVVQGNIVDHNTKFRKQKIYLQEISRLKKELFVLEKQVNQLKSLNDKYTHQIHSITIKKVKNMQNFKNLVQNNNSNNRQNISRSKSQTNLSNKPKIQKTNKLNLQSLKKSTTNLRQRNLQSSNNNNINNNNNNNQQKPNKVDLISQQKTTQLIQQIIVQKSYYNYQNQLKKEQFKSMQQFLFIFFYRKYGLKDIALKWSLSLIKSIQTYSKSSSIIFCFIKILKNQFQEAFYPIHKRLIYQATVIVNQYANKIQNNRKLDKQSYSFSINQVYKIVKRIFGKQFDQDMLESITKKKKSPVNKKQAIYILGQLNLMKHEHQIKDIVKTFKKFDNYQKGYVKSQQMGSILKSYFAMKYPQRQYKEKQFQKILAEMIGQNNQKQEKILFSVFVDEIRKIQIK